MEVSGLGVELELQLPAYDTAIATLDLSHICKPHHSSWQSQILNPLRKVRDQTSILKDTSRVRNPLSHSGKCLTLHYFLMLFLVQGTDFMHPPTPTPYPSTPHPQPTSPPHIPSTQFGEHPHSALNHTVPMSLPLG